MAKGDPSAQDITANFMTAMQSFMAQGANSGASTSGKDDPFLFVGHGNTTFSPVSVDPSTGYMIDPKQKGETGVMTQSQAQMLWYDWTQAQRLQWAKYAFAKGFIDSPTNLAAAQDKWNYAINESVNFFNSHRQQQISPWAVLDMHTGENADVLKKRALVGKDGTITHTNSSINLMDKGHVEALATQVLQQALGRGPTQAEMNTYYATIRGEQQSHPQVTTSRTDAATGEQVGTATTSGGFDETDAAEMLKQRIQNDPEYAKYQAGTTYFQAAMQALGAIGGA